MNKQNAAEIHAMTSAQAGRSLAALATLRGEIVAKRAESYKSRRKMGVPTAAISIDEQAARLIAKRLLNGSAPESFSVESEVDAVDRDILLAREQRGVEIAMKILSDKRLIGLASEAVVWSESNAERWRALARDTVLCCVRLEALQNAASALLGTCPDIFSVRLPMGSAIGGAALVAWATPVGDLAERALAENVINSGDLRKALTI